MSRIKTAVINVSTSVDITRIIPFLRTEIEFIHNIVLGNGHPISKDEYNAICGKLKAILKETDIGS